MNNSENNFYKKTKTKYAKSLDDLASKNIWQQEGTTTYYKEYLRMPKIMLPEPHRLDFSLGEVITKRISERVFENGQASIQELSDLFFYSAGIITSKENFDKTRRAYPSGGARFSLETYLFVFEDSEEINSGIYHYNVKNHYLEKILEEKNLRNIIYPEYIWQDMIQKAPMLLVISSVFERTMMKYNDRGMRYIMLEAGHLGQNICLVSSALNLKCCAIGGFDDDKFNEILDIDDETEGVLYIFSIGR